ncbi:MAG: alpha/beta fold hydrolase [Planctomycetota bacterium]
MELPCRRWGRDPGLLALHGFSLDGRMFAPLAEELGALVAADLPGHGQAATRAASWDAAVAAVAATLTVTGTRALLGYSQGGRLALGVALTHPELVERLVLVSAGVGIEAPDVRARRRADDEALAQQIEAEGIAAFVEAWLARPLVRPALAPEAAAADRALRLEQSPAGLAAALRGLGQGAQPWLGARLPQLACPTLWVAGERDPTYRALAERGAEACPRGEFAVLAAGHNVVAERPRELAALLAR